MLKNFKIGDHVFFYYGPDEQSCLSGIIEDFKPETTGEPIFAYIHWDIGGHSYVQMDHVFHTDTECYAYAESYKSLRKGDNHHSL